MGRLLARLLALLGMKRILKIFGNKKNDIMIVPLFKVGNRKEIRKTKTTDKRPLTEECR